MSISWKRLNRKTHYWGAIICALPILIVILTGIPLLLKKDIAWIQPSSAQGTTEIPTLPFQEILEISKTAREANITTWQDIDRIDVRPDKGILKVRSHNGWEIQLDHTTGAILHTAYRRSDLIESIHDGSFFHKHAKLWIFLPCAILLLILWITGIYLFLLPILTKRARKKKSS